MKSRAFLRNFKVYAVVASLLLIFISPLTQAARSYIAESISASIGYYAIARTLNAGISVLQTVETSLVIASIGVGEALDPVNDAIENYSVLVTWAIGALFAQRFSIDFVELIPVGVTVSFIGASSFVLGKLGFRNAEQLLWRTFVSLFAVRVILIVAIYLSMWLSQAVLDKSISEAQPALEEFNQSIKSLTGYIEVSVPDAAAVEEMRRAADIVAQDLEKLDGNLARLEAERDVLDDELGLVDRWTGGTTPEIDRLDADIQETVEEVARLSQQHDEQVAELDCIDLQMQGDSCQGLWSRATNIDVSKFDDLIGSSSSMINALLLLSAALILKSVAMPILTFVLVMRLVSNWTRR